MYYSMTETEMIHKTCNAMLYSWYDSEFYEASENEDGAMGE